MRKKFAPALAALAALAVTVAATPAAARTQNFTTPVRLGHPPVGGEPSIATDPQGDVLVAGPQGIPSGIAGHPGTGLWISRNDGTSFGAGRYIGSNIGGGDNDVIYDSGAFYTADLEAIASEVCKSTDRGNSWTAVGPVPDPFGCTQVNAGQVGPSDDRPWLAADPTDSSRLYLVYHEFISAQPIAFRTDTGGADGFAHACGSLVTNPAIEANLPTDITGGTLVARPVLGKDGTLYVLFASTTQQENVAAALKGYPSGTFSELYLAVSHDHCQTFTDYTVFDGQAKYGMNTVQFGDIFNNLVIDGAGNLYAVGAGAVGSKQFPSSTNVYVLSSTDHGQHWTGPRMIDAATSAHMLPAAVGGPKAGDLEVGYFRTINGVTDPNSMSGKWTYATAQSTNATAASPMFIYRDVRAGYVYHHGQICNAGVLCGAPNEPSDRSLLDFTSGTLDSHGCPLFTFAGNPTGTPTTNGRANTYNFVTRQLVGCFASVAATSTNSSQATKQKHHHKHHRRHRRSRRAARTRRVPAFTG